VFYQMQIQNLIEFIYRLIADPYLQGIAALFAIIAVAGTIYKPVLKMGIVLVVETVIYALLASLVNQPLTIAPFDLPPFIFLGAVAATLSIFGILAVLSENHSAKSALVRAVVSNMIWLFFIAIIFQLLSKSWDTWFTLLATICGLWFGFWGGLLTIGVSYIDQKYEEMLARIT